MSFEDLFRAVEEVIRPEPQEREDMTMYDRGAYMGKPQKGNLSNYGKDPQHARSVEFQASDPEANKAPQTYVRMMVEFSYDTPRPDPDGTLRRECGAAIRRAVEGRLTGEAMATQLGDATLTLRSMVMRQEDDPAKFGVPVSIGVGELGADKVRFEPADPRDHVDNPKGPIMRPSAETIPNPTPEEARPGFGGMPIPPLPRGPQAPGDLGYERPHPLDRVYGPEVAACCDAYDEDLGECGVHDIPPNAGSSE